MARTTDGHTCETRTLFEQISPLLESIESLYTRLDALGDRQCSLVDADDPAALLVLLQERQCLVDDLRAADERFRPIGERWESESTGLPATQQDWVRVRLCGIAELAARVRDRDELTHGQLVQRRESIAAELSGLSKSRSARAAYGGRSAATPRFQDREG